MQRGRFEITITEESIKKILSQLTDETIGGIRQICECYGDGEDEIRHYDVYIVELDSGCKILKKTTKREVENYEEYLSQGEFNVPQYYGKWIDKDDIWILIEYIEGEDLREMSDTMVELAAESLSQIQNHFWKETESESLKAEIDSRFEVYLKRILRRATSITEEPMLKDAYQLFWNRQLTCPRTLSNGDFLEFNAIKNGDSVYIIDWGFGGVMPYSLDIARFIAHATEDRCTFPFYMNEEQKTLFLKKMYEKLEQKPNYAQYLLDIKLAMLNEYIEFVEAKEDESGWYYSQACKLAKELLNR